MEATTTIEQKKHTFNKIRSKKYTILYVFVCKYDEKTYALEFIVCICMFLCVSVYMYKKRHFVIRMYFIYLSINRLHISWYENTADGMWVGVCVCVCFFCQSIGYKALLKPLFPFSLKNIQSICWYSFPLLWHCCCWMPFCMHASRYHNFIFISKCVCYDSSYIYITKHFCL